MKGLELRPGDIFLSKGTHGLSKAIVAVEWLYSRDGHAEYSHSGVIMNRTGGIFEAGLVNGLNALGKYAGKQILIGRNENMCHWRFADGLRELSKYNFTLYPFHRLFFFFFPPIARIVKFGHGICSELTSIFLFYAGLIDYWSGIMPSDLADMIRHWRGWKTIYEGRLEKCLSF